MTSKLESKLTMYVLVYNQFDISPITASLPLGLRNSIAEFGTVVSSIKLNAQKQIFPITGTATDKLEAKELLATLINSTADCIFSYASQKKDNALMEQSAYSLSGLKKATVTNIVSVAKFIYTLADGNRVQFADFGITEASLAALKEATASYEILVPLPRNQRSDKATTKKKIDLLFKIADDILKNQIDKLMTGQAAAYHDFYTTFVNNRNIIDRPTRGTRLKGKVVSANKPNGLQNVTVTYVETGGKAITKRSGVFVFKQATAGVATLTFSAEGYNDLTLKNIAIKQGQLNIQQVEMKMIQLETEK